MKTILFDIGGVILPEEDLYEGLLADLRQTLCDAGVSVSREEFDTAVRECILSFCPGLRKPLIWRFTKPDVEKYAEIERTVRWSPPPGLPQVPRSGMCSLLESLAVSFKLALAANAGPKVRDILAEHDLLRFFSSTEVSGDLPYAKPDPRFFEHILRSCGSRPEDAVMVGDRLDNDIIPANPLGIRTILYKTGPYAILEPRTPDEVPDVVVNSVEELKVALCG